MKYIFKAKGERNKKRKFISCHKNFDHIINNESILYNFYIKRR